MSSQRQRSTDLLLLPSAPSPDSNCYNALKSAFQPAIAAVLRKLSSDIRQHGAGIVLDVAFPVPFLASNRRLPRGQMYPSIQTLLAGLYKLICVVAAKEHVNVEDLEGVDVRILLLDHSRDSQSSSSSPSATAIGPVITLATLAHSRRPWKRVFSLENEDGDAIYRSFSSLYNGPAQISRVPGGAPGTFIESQEQTEPQNPRKDHFDVILGGTFDHIHIGHKLLLGMFAFLLPAQDTDGSRETSLTIGITGDELLREKKYADLLESWDERKDSVMRFLLGFMDFRPPEEAKMETTEFSDPGPNGHAVRSWMNEHLLIQCVEISDPYGPTITIEHLSALVISAETRSGGKAVNDKRREKGWVELEVFEVDVLDPQEDDTQAQGVESDFQAKLSSTTIRKGLSERAKARSKV